MKHPIKNEYRIKFQIALNHIAMMLDKFDECDHKSGSLEEKDCCLCRACDFYQEHVDEVEV